MTSKELKDWKQWRAASAENRQEAEELEKIWEASGNYRENYSPDVEGGLAKLKARIQKTETPSSTKRRIVKLNAVSQWWRIAAAVLVLLVAGFGVNKLFKFGSSSEIIVATAEKMNKEIILEDGTQVVLNENSSLTFPNNFKGNKRKVFLEGEGFFKVAKDASKPFIVETAQSKVEVLGTSFNFRAYPNESFHEVLVKTGNVIFSGKNKGEISRLSMGQKAKLDLSKSKMKALPDKNFNALSWRTKKLTFRSDPLKTVFSEMERYYKIKIKIANLSILNCPYSSTLKQKKLWETTRGLELAFGLKFEKLKEGVYKVSGGKCPTE